jgi:predicted nuclease with TOPRIM domain
MKGIIPAVALVAITVIVVMRRRRAHGDPAIALSKLRGGVEDALEEMEPAIRHLRQRAKRLRGDASQRLLEQAHELEGRQRDLRSRLDELLTEARRLAERASDQVKAGRKARVS